MSQYGIPFDYDEPWVSGALDLSIETLTGTAFEIRVAPTDTIMSIKTKIQRVEGIPVSQQHLLYNLVELDNSSSVQDYAIQNGATLKLVLSMRGGPISTRRLPPADDALWREVHKWMADGCREEKSDRSSSASRPSFLVFPDGDSVNVFRVVENDDGTYSPLIQSFTGVSLESFLKKDDTLETDKRTMENFVTMGKIQELKGKLEKLSINKKDKKADDEGDEDYEWFNWDPEADSDEKPRGNDELPIISPPPRTSFSEPDFRTPRTFQKGPPSETVEITPLLPTKRVAAVNEGASCSGMSTPLNNIRPPNSDVASSRATMARYNAFKARVRKTRKEAEGIIRLQSKSLSIVVDSQSFANLKPTPLPDIRRSPRPDRLSDDKIADEKNDLRGKTGSRMSASSFAILEEESEVASGPNICSSQSSLVALPSNDDVVVAYSPISRDHITSSLGRSRFRVSRYVLEKAERPKTTPSKIDTSDKDLVKISEQDTDTETTNRKHILCSLDLAPSWYSSEATLQVRDVSNTKSQRVNSYNETYSKTNCLGELRAVGTPDKCNDNTFEPVPNPSTSLAPLQPPSKKRPRCLVCKKRLNITNTHTCRCSGVFCSTHRYSETHDCHFNYKEEGKCLLRLANPLVTASKLPKI